MNNTKWIRILNITLAIGLLSLTACQQGATNVERMQFQGQASQVISDYANRVSEAYAKSQTNSNSNVRGITMYGYNNNYSNNYNSNDPNSYWNQWNPWGGQPFGGQAEQRNMEREVQNCVDLVKNVPPVSQNFYFMVGSLARCLDVVVTYRNPIMTFAYRNLDQYSQLQMDYMVTYDYPQTYNSYGSSNYSYPWSYFNNNGYFYGGYGQ